MRIKLTDGRIIPMVKPTLWDGAEVEKQTGWDQKTFARNMQLSSMKTAFAIFASLRRAGVKITFSECADLDGIEELVEDPGDPGVRDGGSEGEESLDPPHESTFEPGVVPQSLTRRRRSHD